MEIKPLEPSVISKIRSSSDISTVAQCVFELMCNSLDAKSTSIAVRLNLLTFKIQIADNGEGITKANFSLLGQRYATNKCHSLKQLEKSLKTYGYRGEALVSIAEMCKCVTVSSRHKLSEETYSKILSKGAISNVKLVKQRPSQGTTVTVVGWMSTAPVRQARIIPEIELEEVKRQLEALVIINPGTSLTLRNDVTGQLVLCSPKYSDILEALRHLHPEVSGDFTLLKASKSRVSIELLIKKELSLTKHLQYVFVNKRPVKSPKMIKHLRKSLTSCRKLNPQVKRYPVFVMNIKCPQAYVDLVSRPSRWEVEFTCWELVFSCMDRLAKSFLGMEKENNQVQVFVTPPAQAELNYGVSQLRGAIQVCAFKRKGNPSDNAAEKLRKVEGTQVTEGNYEIEDSGNMPKEPVKHIKSIMKKPLAIEVHPVPDRGGTSEDESQELGILDQRSTYSRLDSNEDNGKGLIMDMFLKSTQVYKGSPCDGVPTSNISGETIEETNYLFENKVRDIANGIDTTMSMSVNVKKRTVKQSRLGDEVIPNTRDSPEEPSRIRRRRVLAPKICKSVQTSPNLAWGRQKSLQSELSEELNKFSLYTNDQSNNYTILLDTTIKPRYVFKKKSEEAMEVEQSWNIMPFKPLKICHCDQEKRSDLMFSFKDKGDLFKRPLTPAVVESPYFRKSKPDVIASPYFRKPHAIITDKNKSKYEEKERLQHLQDFSEDPKLRQHEGQQTHQNHEQAQIFGHHEHPLHHQLWWNHPQPYYVYPPPACGCCAPWASSNNFYDRPPYARDIIYPPERQMKPAIPKPATISCGPSWYNPEVTEELAQGPTPDIFFSEMRHDDHHLEVGLSDSKAVRENVRKELEEKEKTMESLFVSDKSRIVVDSQNEWLRKFNEHGDRFFLNKRSGMVTVKTPAKTQTNFAFAQRSELVPKGLSPVMVERGKVDQPLSQNAKNRLHNMILQSYQDELMVVKWQNCISGDPKEFFEEIYRHKSEQFERCIPNIEEAHLKAPLDPLNFNNLSFNNFEVIGQLDRKFIVVLDKERNLLVVFDQHAAHERVLLEKYLREYKGAKAVYKEKVTIFMPHNDLQLLQKHLSYVESLGFELEFFTNGIHITHVPLCVSERFADELDDLNNTINRLIRDLVEDLKVTRGATKGTLPPVLQGVINMKACRGAIKFGDVLVPSECSRMLRKLSKCNLPFQCAHGRPTLAPLLSLSKVPSVKVQRVNLRKLRHF